MFYAFVKPWSVCSKGSKSNRDRVDVLARAHTMVVSKYKNAKRQTSSLRNIVTFHAEFILAACFVRADAAATARTS